MGRNYIKFNDNFCEKSCEGNYACRRQEAFQMSQISQKQSDYFSNLLNIFVAELIKSLPKLRHEREEIKSFYSHVGLIPPMWAISKD